MAFLGHFVRSVNPTGGELAGLLARPAAEQERLGYRHTLPEIMQQPATWLETASRVAGWTDTLKAALAALRGDAGEGTLILTGSGSSLHLGESLALALQPALGVPVRVVPAGTLLTHPQGFLPASGSCLVVSFARSGNSPESCAVIDTLREASSSCRHLIFTCNPEGRLATRYRNDPHVTTLLLDERTNDRSLVMTSSFTNLALAGRFLAFLDRPAEFAERVARLARVAAELIEERAGDLAALARSGFGSVVFLGSGPRFGSAREAALKMLEMSAGAVKALPETYLGLRHGPMCAIDGTTLVVGFLSSDRVVRSYERDLLRELDRKALGARKLIFGEGVPEDVVREGDLVIDVPGLATLGDEDVPVLDVVLGQLLAFFRCLDLGLRPDSPAVGVLSRVVEDFAIYPRGPS